MELYNSSEYPSNLIYLFHYDSLAAAQVYPSAPAFADKRIIVVPDLDEAGTRSAEELQRRFRGIAKSIEFADLREVTSA